MKCSYCSEIADFKCACQEPFMCQFHLEAHLETMNNHPFENLDEELGDLRLSRFRLKLIKRIQKIRIAKSELASKSKLIIESIQRAFIQASGKLDSAINSYIELLKRFKFFCSELQKIELIESLDIKVRTIKVGAIKTLVKNTYLMYLITFEKTEINELNHFLNQHCGGFLCGAITDDCETLVTGGCDSAIRVWDLILKQQKFVFLGHNSDVSCIALTGDGKHIISGSVDTSVRVWNLQQKSKKVVFIGHKGQVRGICYVEKYSLIISGDEKCEIIIWSLTRYSIIKKLILSGAICSLVLMKTHRCIIAGEGNNISFLKLGSLKKHETFQGHTKNVISLALSNDERRMVSGSEDGTIIVWDLIEIKKLYKLVGHFGPVNSVALIFNDTFIVSGSDDYSVRLWEMENGIKVFNYKDHKLPVNMILRANQDFLSLSGDSGIGQLGIANGTFEVNWFFKPFLYNFVEFSTESRLIGYGSQKEALVWDLEREAVTNVLIGHKFEVKSVEISRDGKFALSCSLGGIINLIYWDLSRNQKVGELNGHTNTVFCVSFSKDGLSAASGSADMSVRTWNLTELKQVFIFEGHSGSVYSIKFVSNKNLLVSAGGDKKVYVWNLSEKTPYAVLSGHNDIIWKVLVTEDEEYIVSGDLTDGIRIWNVEKKQQEFNFKFEKEVSDWLKKNGIKLVSVRRFLKF